MWRVTRKGVWAHKLRFGLTALAVFLGVAFMSGTLVLTDTIRKTFDDLFADVFAGTDAWVRNSEDLEGAFGPTQRPRISAELIPEVEAVEGVEVAEGALQFYAQFVDRDGEAMGNPGQGAPTFGRNWVDVDALNPWNLEDGSRPPEAADEVVMDKGSADEGDFDVGDTVTILTQGAPAEYEIVGIAKFGDIDSPGGASTALFSTEQAQAISGAEGEFDAISVVGDGDESQEALAARIQDALDDPELEVLTGKEITEENQSDLEEAISFIRIPLLIFGAIALLVGSFLIFNTFSIVVAQRTRELALLRAIGASRTQVTVSVVGEALVVGLLASLLGLVAGIGLSTVLKAALAGFGFDVPSTGIVVTPLTIAIAIGVGTVITVVSAVVPAVKGARVPPVAAIRDVAIDRTSRPVRRAIVGFGLIAVGAAGVFGGLFGDLENNIYYVGLGALLILVGATTLGPVFAGPSVQVIGWPLPRLRGMTGALARQNAARSPRRTSATAAALMIGVAIVGFFTVFASSAKATLDTQVDRAFASDFVIAPDGGGGFGFTGFSPDLAAAVAEVPEVEASTALRFGFFDVEADDEFFMAFDPATVDQLLELEPREGAFEDLTVDGIAISQEAADDNGWELGSEVQTQFPTGERTLTVETIFGIGLREGLTDYALSIEAADAGTTEQIDQQVLVKLADGVSPDEGRRALEEAVAAYPQAEVQDQEEFKETFSAQINQFLGLIYVLLALAVLIALIGIANTLALSVYERTREIGLLRAVGMTRRQLRSAVRWEAVIIAVLGTLIGLTIGLFFGWAVVKALADEGFETFAAPVGQLIAIVIASGIAGVIAAAFPARRAAKLDVLRAVSTE